MDHEEIAEHLATANAAMARYLTARGVLPPDKVSELERLALAALRALVLVIPLLLVTVGCYPVPPHDCVTSGGMLVQNADCASLEAIQARTEQAIEDLGYGANALRGVVLSVRRDGLSDVGSFDLNGFPAWGSTRCEGALLVVAALPDWTWEQTAFAHEAFHWATRCAWDASAYRACLDLKDPALNCAAAATHVGWDVNVYPVLQRVNAP